MSLRKWICVVATLGMLLHAGAFVRHALAMATPTSASELALIADLGVICHSDQGGDATASADLPPPASKPDQSSKCPMCLGLAAAFALPSMAGELLPPATGPPARVAIVQDYIVLSRGSALPPPARGPPRA